MRPLNSDPLFQRLEIDDGTLFLLKIIWTKDPTCISFDPIQQITLACRYISIRIRFESRLNIECGQLIHNAIYGGLGVSIVLASPYAHEPPANTLKNSLALHVFLDFRLAAVPSFPIAFDGNTPIATNSDHIYSVGTNLPLLDDLEASADKRLAYRQLEWRIRFSFNFLLFGDRSARIGGVVKQALAYIRAL